MSWSAEEVLPDIGVSLSRKDHQALLIVFWEISHFFYDLLFVSQCMQQKNLPGTPQPARSRE
jgi:hypothetical protein